MSQPRRLRHCRMVSFLLLAGLGASGCTRRDHDLRLIDDAEPGIRSIALVEVPVLVESAHAPPSQASMISINAVGVVSYFRDHHNAPMFIAVDSSSNVVGWGARGEGPGEIALPGFLLTHDSLIIHVDPSTRRVSAYTSDGRLARENRFGPSYLAVAASGDSLLVLDGYPPSDPGRLRLREIGRAHV